MSRSVIAFQLTCQRGHTQSVSRLGNGFMETSSRPSNSLTGSRGRQASNSSAGHYIPCFVRNQSAQRRVRQIQPLDTEWSILILSSNLLFRFSRYNLISMHAIYPAYLIVHVNNDERHPKLEVWLCVN
jgi:hypothetical protein